MGHDLSKISFKTLYSNPSDVADFYSNALSVAKQYKRVSAYFSVGIFKYLKKGLPDFIRQNDGYMQLIISQEVDEKTLRLINDSYLKRDENSLSKIEVYRRLEELCLQEDADLFSFLIATGRLDIKMAFKSTGIVHDKFGIIDDGVHTLAYVGSINFTENGLVNNDEIFQTTIDWDNPSSREIQTINELNNLFEDFWENRKKDVFTIDLPDPIVDKMIKQIDYNKIKSITPKFDFVRLDIRDSEIVLSSNVELKDILSRKNIGEYSSFIEETEKGFVLKKINRVNEMYDFKKALETSVNQANVSLFLTKRASDFFALHYRDYVELAKIGAQLKDEKFIESDSFAKYKKDINSAVIRPLKDKQIQAACHIIEMERSLNFSVPGSGKTATVLGAFEYLSNLSRTNKKHVDKLLVIGPVNCAKAWRDEYGEMSEEAKAHPPLCLINNDGITEKLEVLAHDFDSSRLIIINYELLPKLAKTLTKVISERTMVVFDEIHRIKRMDSPKYLALKEIIRQTRFRVALTGTPLPNGYIDLFNMVDLLHDDFSKSYFKMYPSVLKDDDATYKKYGVQDEELNQRLFPFYIRVSKKELNVPFAEPDHLIDIQTNKYERELYWQIVNAKYGAFESTIKLIEIGCVPFKCNQDIEDYKTLSSNYDRRLSIGSKLTKFLSVVKKNNNKCVVWCIFVDTINLVCDLLNENGISAKSIYGSTPQDERDKIIDEFNYGKLQVIVTNPATLAESVSLHKACHEAHYLELNYNLYQYLQSRDRIHRLGLKDSDKTNYYIYLNYYDDENKVSKDLQIYNALRKKEELMQKSIEKGNFVFGDTNDFEMN